tara:strand:- start:1803 stop:2030 length:228 start_codon:yes stop_codon:yes gene_type:complete
MNRETAYLIDQSDAGFRRNQPAEIVGVEMCTPLGLEPRLCYHLKWSDSVEDWKPVSEKTYKIVTFTDLLAGDYKK